MAVEQAKEGRDVVIADLEEDAGTEEQIKIDEQTLTSYPGLRNANRVRKTFDVAEDEFGSIDNVEGSVFTFTSVVMRIFLLGPPRSSESVDACRRLMKSRTARQRYDQRSRYDHSPLTTIRL